MESDNISIEIVERVADREGVDPTDLEPLYDVVDPEALETLVDGACDGTIEVEFSYYGYEIVVDGNGTVSIDDEPPSETATDA